MANTTQIAIISILAILGIGAIAGGLYGNIYIGDQLDQGIKDTLTIDPDDEEDYEDWLNKKREETEPTYDTLKKQHILSLIDSKKK